MKIEKKTFPDEQKVSEEEISNNAMNNGSRIFGSKRSIVTRNTGDQLQAIPAVFEHMDGTWSVRKPFRAWTWKQTMLSTPALRLNHW